MVAVVIRYGVAVSPTSRTCGLTAEGGMIDSALVGGFLLATGVYHDRDELAGGEVEGAFRIMTKRTIIILDGSWDAAGGAMDVPPAAYHRRTPVPGLMDQAQPAFEAVAPPLPERTDDAWANTSIYRNRLITDPRRDAFWLRRTFTIDGRVPPVARLKVHKAMYGTHVRLNGQRLGEHLPNFTPGYFDLRPALRGNGTANELLIRIGAARDASPSSPLNGHDHEKIRYIPGIYDSVELILTGTPWIQNVQIAPDLHAGGITLRAELIGDGVGPSGPVRLTVRERDSSAVVTRAELPGVDLPATGPATLEHTLAIPGFRQWSPEDPFLYTLVIETSGDRCETSFGMRSFAFDPATRKPMLNGERVFLRGTNFCFHRFCEDDERAALPWDRDWVRRLMRVCRSMNWNFVRFCIGFPPDFWYDIADEEGLLVQDEFPAWDPPDRVTLEDFVNEYTQWMRERWNRPCVIIWDAQNETPPDNGGEAIGRAIDVVRELDLSDRPWDNGWSQPRRPTDPVEVHPYLLNRGESFSSLDEMLNSRPRPELVKGQKREDYTNPLIVNEYGWMWIDRQGRPGLLARKFRVYEHFLLSGVAQPTAEQYRRAYARTLALLTEYWRAHGDLAAIQHFCTLGYSRPDGHTSDNWLDLAQLQLEHHFAQFVPDAFASTIAVPDLWQPRVAAGRSLTGQVILINDGPESFAGELELDVAPSESDAAHTSHREYVQLEPWSRAQVSFQLELDLAPGDALLRSALTAPNGYRVRSRRNVRVVESGSPSASTTPHPG